MDIAKITYKGQITIPAGIRKKMNLKDGDKVIFFEQDGKFYLESAALMAINRMQMSFEGEAERSGLKDENDVVALVKEIRKERWDKKEKAHADNG